MANKKDIEWLFKAHYTKMLCVAKAILHDDDSARDVVQDVFASLLYDKANTGLPSEYYLVAAVRNRCLNLIRDLGTRERVANLFFLENADYDAEEWHNDTTISELYSIITNDLSAQGRRVMELRFVEGLTFVKIAEKLGVSENAVYKHVRQSILTIRKKLKDNG